MALSTLSYGGFTTGAMGPAYGTLAEFVIPNAPATLSYDGDTAVITGSVDDMFQTASFIGPDRTTKQDRARISVNDDVMLIAASFDTARTEIAELREIPVRQSAERLATQLAEAGLVPGAIPDVPSQQVAAIDPTVTSSIMPTSVGSSALDAISAIAPDQTVPMPVVASTQLAYARESAPITEFGGYDHVKYSDKELWCLAVGIYFEARGEIYRGQVGVAQVIMNRTKHKLYPKTICGVVFQNQQKRNACQFSFACDGKPETINDQTAWAQAQEIATKVVSGELYLSDVANATHYHASYVYPHWAPRMKKLTKIGLHVFYRFKKDWSYG